MNQSGNYAIIWFEDESIYRLVDHQGHLKVFDIQQIDQENTVSEFIKTQDDIDNAEDSVRYAITIDLLEDTYGPNAVA